MFADMPRISISGNPAARPAEITLLACLITSARRPGIAAQISIEGVAARSVSAREMT